MPLYLEMFNKDWIYSGIALKPPYLNFIRNREEIVQKIWNSVENYINYSLQKEVENIKQHYYNSNDLKEVLCKLTK